jgi:uncharacterized tellurite resistance protein B-like protein
MTFWDLFKKDTPEDSHSRLYRKLQELLPGQDEQKLIYTACVSGLLARIIHIDLKVHDDEIEAFKDILKRYYPSDERTRSAIVDLALNEVKELVDLENQKYSRPLNEFLSEKEKYNILQMLFEVSAADGVVENLESEEIRLVTKSLLLTDQHFLSARAEVKDKLGAAKK